MHANMDEGEMAMLRAEDQRVYEPGPKPDADADEAKRAKEQAVLEAALDRLHAQAVCEHAVLRAEEHAAEWRELALDVVALMGRLCDRLMTELDEAGKT